MATVTMPQLGESVTEGTILKWLKQPGDPVTLDDPLCEIETEKVTAELPSPFEGTMGEIVVKEGETVEIGAPLCEVLEAPAGVAAREPAVARASAGGGWSGGPMAIPPEESAAPAPNGASYVASPRPARAASAPARNPENRERYYSPAVMRLAQDHEVDLTALKGSGVGGRITRKDVEAAVARGSAGGAAQAPVAAVQAPARPGAARPAEAGAPFTVVQLSPTRRTIAENLKRSNLEAPQAWTMVEVDVTNLVRLREREKERFRQQEGVDLTLLPYFTRSVCETLRDFPILNARWEGEELRQYRALNIGVAIATEHGLVVPVVHDAEDLSIEGLAKHIAELVQRAHSRKLNVEDIEGGTFTVNNTGSFGSIASKPIVNYPQVGIVSMERVVKRPVVKDDDSIAIRSMMNACLSFDHRAMDGLAAGGFLAALKKRLEAIG